MPFPRDGLFPSWLWCSLASGLLLSAAFPPLGWDGLIWLGLVPLLWVMERRPFLSGYLAGLTFYLFTLSWLSIVMTQYGGMPLWLAIPVRCLLAAYLALFFGGATSLSCRIASRLGWSPVVVLPVTWVALEWARNYCLTGFPWGALGYALEDRSWVIQSADLWGIYGVTFLVVLGNVSLAVCLARVLKRPLLNQQSFKPVAAAAVLLLLNLAYGGWSLSREIVDSGEQLNVAVIQGNIDQAVKWSPEYRSETVAKYIRLSMEAASDGVDLVVWPEAATPFYFQDPTPLSQKINQLPRQMDAALLVGSPAYRREEGRVRYLNSAFLLDSRGEYLGRSDKVHLVPFGEYVPLSNILTFVDKMVVGIGDFSPGTLTPLPMNGHKMGVLVCYESIFPELARTYVRRGANVLVNITNDAWFGRSGAPWQHLAMARFRAIENRVWLVRSANTGISALIDPTGRLTLSTDLFATTWAKGRVSLLPGKSLYNRLGDWLPLVASIFSALGLALSFRKRPVSDLPLPLQSP